MTIKKTVAFGAATVMALSLAACSSSEDTAASGEGATSGELVTAYGSEPQNPLVPADTTENGGGRIVQLTNSMLVYYDAAGEVHNDLAESIELEGEKTYKVTLREGLKFSDGSDLKAENFVAAWNFAVENALQGAYFFEPILGFEEGKPLEGLKVVDDRTFTIELTQAESDFPTRLGYNSFAPMPLDAVKDLESAKAYGEKPVASGPYVLSEWNHNQDATLVPNEHYDGPRKAKNDGLKFVFYTTLDAAYSDLLAGNLDVLDGIPDSAFGTFETELSGRSVNQPAATFYSFTLPERLEHFSGEEGKLRRQAISMALNRQEITDTIYQGFYSPATDFTSPVIPGHSKTLKGAEVLQYNPEKAKELWAKADAISPFTGSFQIAYNADGGHQSWVDAVTNQLKNTLNIEASGNPYPDFKSLRDDVTNRTIKTASRSGWQADYPSMSNFLNPLYATGGSSNDGDYSSAEFDGLMKRANGAPTVEEGRKLYIEGQELLLQDLPVIPLWNKNILGGYSEKVDNVVFGWDSAPLYQDITKK